MAVACPELSECPYGHTNLFKVREKCVYIIQVSIC